MDCVIASNRISYSDTDITLVRGSIVYDAIYIV